MEGQLHDDGGIPSETEDMGTHRERLWGEQWDRLKKILGYENDRTWD